MFKSNSKLLLSLIAGVAVAGVTGTFFWFGGMGNNTQTVANWE
jgi:high-affinity Fe2+/Pb2+ permease